MAASTKQANFRVDPKLWDAVIARAKRDKTTITRVVTEALTAHVTKGKR